ncbi:MAG: DUF4158 domain-containing protein [Chloroflexi bacterium]|nr:DUF4158 domain-containing protein [Chloroflexota bacterium]
MDARVERSNAVGQQDWRDPPRVRRVAHLFPSRRSLSTSKHEVPSAIVAHLASQVGVPVDAYVAYDWRGRTIKYHRVQIRIALGFRETSVEDADNLVDWLTHEVVPHERGIDRVRAAVYARCRELRFEPPTQERIERLVRSALASHEQQISRAVHGRLSAKSVEVLDGLLTPTKPSLAEGELARAPLVELKKDPGPAGLESVLAEIAKLQRLRAIGLQADLFADVAPKTRQGYRQRVQVEEALRTASASEPLRSTLLAAWAALRSGELTDNLVDTLVQTIERIDTTAQHRVEQELLADFRRVTGKTGLLFRVAEASVERPDGIVRDVVFSRGGW